MTTRRPESPCIRQCTLDPETDICVGCYRTIEEIIGWTKYSTKKRLTVLGELGDRKTNYVQIRDAIRANKKNQTP